MLFLKEFFEISKSLEADFNNKDFIKEILLQRENNKYSKKMPGNALNNHLRTYLLKMIKFPIMENLPFMDISGKHHALASIEYECDLFNTKNTITATIVKNEEKRLALTFIVENFLANKKSVSNKSKITFLFDENYEFEFIHFDVLDKDKNLYHKVDIKLDSYLLEVGKFSMLGGRTDRKKFDFSHINDLFDIKELLLLENDYKISSSFIKDCLDINEKLTSKNQVIKKPNI